SARVIVLPAITSLDARNRYLLKVQGYSVACAGSIHVFAARFRGDRGGAPCRHRFSWCTRRRRRSKSGPSEPRLAIGGFLSKSRGPGRRGTAAERRHAAPGEGEARD